MCGKLNLYATASRWWAAISLTWLDRLVTLGNRRKPMATHRRQSVWPSVAATGAMVVVWISCWNVPVFGQSDAPAGTPAAADSAAQPARLTIEQLPGYELHQRANRLRSNWSSVGRVSQIQWDLEKQAVLFSHDGKRWQLNLNDGTIAEAPKPTAEDQPNNPARGGRGRGGRAPVARATQRAVEPSPDGKWKAVYRNFNLYLEATAEGAEPIAVTTNGTEFKRFGTGCWVYGEELNQNDAMWWSPDSRYLAYYEMDESELRNYYLTLSNSALYTELSTVRYPKAGDPNPVVGLWIYDLETKQSRRLKIPGEPTQYLYDIQYSPKGDYLLVHRTNRHQDDMDWLACSVTSDEVRVVVNEKQSTWQNNSPFVAFLNDGERFIWETEKSGWKQFELRHLDGRLLNPLTPATAYPCERVERIDEATGWVYYSAYSDSNPYNLQLHRAQLDGTQDRRLTTSPLCHSNFDIAPNHQWVTAVREQFDVPPTSVVYATETQQEWVMLDGTQRDRKELGAAVPELFSFPSSDGQVTLWGTLQKPTHFDPNKSYPLLIDVYGGPESRAFTNRYSPINPICELGYIVAKIGNRGTVGRGKAFESATYRELGKLDLDDQAAGVLFLGKRPEIDRTRVGIFGHSYGGYMSALAMLRYPDLFQVSVSGAPVTDWKNYDTIYTERYMRTPQENKEGYEIGSCMKYAKQLRGHLMIVHGLVDDNVHPSNTWQLAQALHAANRRFDMMIYPEFAHGIGSTYNALRWEYFHEHLRPEVPQTGSKKN